ncbi:hypothetical protein OL239_04130 [Arthrobacter sp. ATA002]|uniref:hypothetical protein n=1 Tax=Arthrobacter sp. ATA002 TaxID=2991715 RepID=UPI0022A74C1F|nr:hypothetical protein [Arthrobacter sp. ATA002]WAP52459.1 hypothetical protein OL239_04130 [Arthrobacter sp. ATA002]
MSGRILHVTRRVGGIMGRLLLYVLIWAGLALLIAAVGIRFYWGEISVNQMLLNLVSVETDGGEDPLCGWAFWGSVSCPWSSPLRWP